MGAWQYVQLHRHAFFDRMQVNHAVNFYSLSIFTYLVLAYNVNRTKVSFLGLGACYFRI